MHYDGISGRVNADPYFLFFCTHFRSGLVGQSLHDWLVWRHESERPPQPLKVKHEHEMWATRGCSHRLWCAMMPHNCTFRLYYAWTCAEANPDIVSARGFHSQFSVSPALFKTVQEDNRKIEEEMSRSPALWTWLIVSQRPTPTLALHLSLHIQKKTKKKRTKLSVWATSKLHCSSLKLPSTTSCTLPSQPHLRKSGGG